MNKPNQRKANKKKGERNRRGQRQGWNQLLKLRIEFSASLIEMKEKRKKRKGMHTWLSSQ